MGAIIAVGPASFLFAVATGGAGAPPAQPSPLRAANDARNREFVEINKEVQACQGALKADTRAGISFCGKEAAPRKISKFICQNAFFSCKTPADKLRLKAVVAAWILSKNNTLLKPRKGRGNLAELIIVLDDQNAEPKLAQLCHGGAMQGFKAKPCKKWDGRDIAGWVSGFISAAADNAHYFYRVKVGKASKSKTLKSIQKGAEPSSAFGTGAGKNPNAGVSSSFGVKQLYMDGAVTAWIVTNPQTGAGRWISVKYFTSRDPNHQIIQQVGIFDFTEQPSQIYGRRYPDLNASTPLDSLNLDVDNLDLVPNRPKFHLTIKNGQVTISAAGSSQPVIKTTLQDLREKRMQQVNSEGYLETIGGKVYRALGQGGNKGSLLFFDTDSHGHVASLDPVAMAEVNQMTAAGVEDLVSGPYETGLGPMPPGSNQFYYMRKSPDGAYLQPVVCKESEIPQGEKCDWPPAPVTSQKNGQMGNGADNSGTVSKASDCSAVSQDPKAITVGSISFIPHKNSPSMLFCAAGTQISVSGLLKNAALSKGDNLTLTVVTPDPGDSKKKPDYASIYKNVNFPIQLSVQCPDKPGEDQLPCQPALFGIPVMKETKYIIGWDVLKQKQKGSNLPSSEELASMSVIFDLRVTKDKKMVAPYGTTIKSKTQDLAEQFWQDHLKNEKKPIPYGKSIRAFVSSSKCAKGDIEIRGLLVSELKKADASEPVVTCGQNQLTAGELLKGL